MRKDSRSWSLVIGGLLILIACVFGYFSSKSSEADISKIREIAVPFIAMCA